MSIDEYVKKVVDEAPPMTPEQRNRLRILLSVPDGDDEVKRSAPIDLEIER
ncbi:hypothetical protein [Aeromicrobium sp. Leaf291]|uniref:hypothetical protein n=1 Tax=Aeromicrobium sp. Leaf291 TaxID=1736325 RepID=UPI000B0D1B8B|nr:hypothetical protein [Aeromicrobium sp. Leaf291]